MPELHKEDNLQLAQSAKTVIDGFLQLHDRGHTHPKGAGEPMTVPALKTPG